MVLENIKKSAKVFLILTVIAVGYAGIKLDFSREWLQIFLPAAAFMILLIFFLIKSVDDSREYNFLDLKEYHEHQNMTIDSLEEIFDSPGSRDDFQLKVKLTGNISGSKEIRAPHSGVGCYGYRIRVGLIKGSSPGKDSQRYAYSLLDETEITELTLHNGNDSIRLGKTPLLNLMTSRSEILSWKGFDGLSEELKRKLNNIITLKKINRNNFSGLSITEELMEKDEEYTVYGICRLVNRKLIIDGNNIVNNPNSLYITSIGNDERNRKLQELKKARGIRATLMVPLLMLLLAVPGYYSYEFFGTARGLIYYTKSNLATKIELTNMVSNHSGTFTWTFEQEEVSSESQLTATGNQDVIVNKDTSIALFKRKKEERIYKVGQGDFIAWKSPFWSLNFQETLPPSGIESPHHICRIYIKNSSSRSISFTFYQASGEVDMESTWTWDPGDGAEYEWGTYPTYDEGKAVIFQTGDILVAKSKDNILRSFVPGYSEEIRYLAADNIWQLTLTDENLEKKSGKLYVRNPSDSYYRLYIYNFDGQYLYDSYWEYNPQEHADLEEGHYLIYTYSNDTSDTILLREGMAVKVIQITDVPYWQGKLGQSPYASFDVKSKSWKITVE